MRFLAGLLIAAVVLAADQGSKFMVLHMLHLQDGHILTPLPFLSLVLVWNHGITFGLFAGAGAKILLAVIATAVVIALFVWMARTQDGLTSAAVGAIAGGAIGNVLDRMRYGAVVDFLHVHYGPLDYPWVFNVGNSAIVCGVIALMLANLLAKPPVAADRPEG